MKLTGTKAFTLLLSSQSLSLLGSGMTRFALLIWAYEKEGTATALALLGFFITTAYVIASPIAGVFVDRWDRRKVLLFSDLGSGMMTAMMLLLFLSGELQLWHLYLMEGIAGILEAFQDPAFSASVSLLVPKETYTRSNAWVGLGRSITRLLAPALAGLLLQSNGLAVVMLADLGTLALALVSLFFLRIPPPPPSQEGQQASGNFFKQMAFGMRYILQRPGLRGILFILFLINLFGTITYFAIQAPMILARSGGNELDLGLVRSVMGIGGIAGGIGVVLWVRKSRNRVKTFLISTMLSFLIGDLITALSRGAIGWAIAGFFAEFTIPFIISPYYALWQELVPPDVQGRVFSSRDMIQIGAQPIGYLLGGLLADGVFEPALAQGGALSSSFGLLVGTGPGAGMAAMFLCTAILGCLVGVLGLLNPHIRRLESDKN
ncbi:MAG TPA: MFS transporter [Anaerolineaceae bacterium]|nr:MFS transporter [Anaerolineaceae bacterium]